MVAYTQTGNGIISMWTNFLVYVSVINWPLKGKDVLNLLRLIITDRYKNKFVHMLIFPFPVCMYAAIYYKNGRRLILTFLQLIAAYKQTGYGIINMRTNFIVYLSVINWPPKLS